MKGISYCGALIPCASMKINSIDLVNGSLISIQVFIINIRMCQ